MRSLFHIILLFLVVLPAAGMAVENNDNLDPFERLRQAREIQQQQEEERQRQIQQQQEQERQQQQKLQQQREQEQEQEPTIEIQTQSAPITEPDQTLLPPELLVPEPEVTAPLPSTEQEGVKQEAKEGIEAVKPPMPAQQNKEVIKLSGRLQLDYRHHSQADANADEQPLANSVFSIRRARVEVKGTLRPNIKYKSSIELAGSARAKDLYIKIKQNNHLSYEGGQFSYPFGNERLSSSRYYVFSELAMLSNTFSGGRDRGVMMLGKYFDERLFYSAGILNGTGTATPDQNSHLDFAGRFQAMGFSLREYNLQLWFGGSFATGKRSSSEIDSIEIVPESVSDFTLFKTELPNDMEYTRQRLSLDGKLFLGPALVGGEYLEGDFTYSTKASVKGGYLFASYFITGEHR
ncbi:MAG: porin, partial [Gammaproteobacteria bacterium]|nr:porin [Gammaproteobacteria bacterium]